MPLTPLQRLDNMLAAAPNAADAERLLHHLCVFHSAFSRAAIIALAPEDMSAEQRTAAFATLCQWRVLRKTSHRSYEIDVTIKHRFPLSEALRRRHLVYFTTLPIYADDNQRFYTYWKDIAAALLWGFQKHPTLIDDLASNAHTDLIVRRDNSRLLETLRQVAESLMAANQFIERLSETEAEACYEMALETYMIARHRERLIALTVRARVSYALNHLSEARLYYEQALALVVPGKTQEWRHRVILQMLLHIVVQQHDHQPVYAYAQQLEEITSGSRATYAALERFMTSIGDFSAARHYLLLSLYANTGPLSDLASYKLLRKLAHLEYKHRHYEEATSLYRLALAEAMRHVETYREHDIDSMNDAKWNTFARLLAEWQDIEARIAKRLARMTRRHTRAEHNDHDPHA